MKRTKTKTRKKRTRTGTNGASRVSARAGAASAALVALFCFAGLCFGQVQPPVADQGGTSTRSIVGTVLSDSGTPIPGAHVLLKNGKTLQVRSFIAQEDGKYHFYGLSSDVNYEVRAQANGMTSKTRNVSVFDSHKIVRVNLKVNRKKG